MITFFVREFIAWFIAAIGFILYAQCAFGDPDVIIKPKGQVVVVYPGHMGAPTTVVQPDGTIDYVYPGQGGGPTTVIDASGGITYAYPGLQPLETPTPSLPVILPYGVEP